MTLLERILRDPIVALDVPEIEAFKGGPETFNIYRMALENGPDISTDVLMRVISQKNGLGNLHARCMALLGGADVSRSTQTIRALGDPFLASYEWATIRMRALKEHGAACQCCGKTAKDGIVINVDHIKPRRDFPELALDVTNLQVLCGECNKGKGNWDATDWRNRAA